jgi:hypothetical protein
MTGDLVPLPTFEGREIRVLEQAGTVWMPLVDLAAAWGLHRNTLRDIIQRNEKKFDGFVSTGAHETCAAGLAVVNEHGLYLLMGAVNTTRLKNPAAADALLRFQRWVPELIQRFRRGEIQQVPAVFPPIDEELVRARYLAEQTGGHLASFQAIALKKCGLGEYVPALNIPQIIHGEVGIWLNATQIGSRCGHSAREANHFLEWHRFQFKRDGIWRLTEKGEVHGEEYWMETTNKHLEIRIRWKESILVASGLMKAHSELQVARA